MIDDILVGFEDAVRELVISYTLPDVFDGVQYKQFWWQRQDGDVLGDSLVVGHVPYCLIHHENGMGVISDVAGYLDQMLVRRMSVAPRHYEGGRFAGLEAYCAEYVDRARALVVRRGWS